MSFCNIFFPRYGGHVLKVSRLPARIELKIIFSSLKMIENNEKTKTMACCKHSSCPPLNTFQTELITMFVHHRLIIDVTTRRSERIQTDIAETQLPFTPLTTPLFKKGLILKKIDLRNF